MIQIWKNLRSRTPLQHFRLAVVVLIFLSCILVPAGGYIIETREPTCRPKIVSLRVSGNSMLPVLHNGQSIVIEDLSAGCSHLSRGDIVVFKSPLDSSTHMVKRLAGVPGDFVTRNQKNQLIINDLPAINIEKKAYFIESNQWISIAKSLTEELRIPEGKFLVWVKIFLQPLIHVHLV